MRIAARCFTDGCESPELGWRKQEKWNEREENTQKMLTLLKDVETVDIGFKISNIQFKTFKIPFFMFGQLCSKRLTVQQHAQEGGCGWAEAVPCWDLVLGCSRGRSQPGLSNPTHPRHALSTLLFHSSRYQTVLLGIRVGQYVTLQQVKLILGTSPPVGDESSSTGQNMLLLSRMRWLCHPNHFHSNMQNAINVTVPATPVQC